jgi:hypothetical protein
MTWLRNDDPVDASTTVTGGAVALARSLSARERIEPASRVAVMRRKYVDVVGRSVIVWPVARSL